MLQGDQMAGVFTLNMKLIQSCVCEALGLLYSWLCWGFVVCCSYYHVIKPIPTTPAALLLSILSPQAAPLGFLL